MGPKCRDSFLAQKPAKIAEACDRWFWAAFLPRNSSPPRKEKQQESLPPPRKRKAKQPPALDFSGGEHFSRGSPGLGAQGPAGGGEDGARGRPGEAGGGAAAPRRASADRDARSGSFGVLFFLWPRKWFSVVRWHQLFFPFFVVAAPLKMVFPKTTERLAESKESLKRMGTKSRHCSVQKTPREWRIDFPQRRYQREAISPGLKVVPDCVHPQSP